MVAPLEHLLEVHLGDALRRLMGVVVVIDIDHQAAQQVANLVCNFNLKLIQLTRLEVISDVVVRQEGNARFDQPFTDSC